MFKIDLDKLSERAKVIDIYLRRNDGINSDEELVSLARKNNWGGKGVETNPYIIEAEEGLPSQLYFLNVSQYVVMKNCNFEILEFVKSSNLRVTNCSLKRLNLIECSCISIENIKMSNLYMSKAKENNFDNCEIKELSGRLSRENTFQNCKLPDDAQEKLTEKIIAKPQWYFILSIGFLTLINVFFQIDSTRLFIWIIDGFFVAIFLASIIKRAYYRIIKPNKFIK